MNFFKVTIETPRNSRGKYYYETETGIYRLKKMLPLGMVFPYDFGMLKGTIGEDGDPLDAMVFAECETWPGIEIECRLIGALLANQRSIGEKQIRNDRYFFVPKSSIAYAHISNIIDFSNDHNNQLKEFFIQYNKVAKKEFIPIKLLNATQAERQLRPLLINNRDLLTK